MWDWIKSHPWMTAGIAGGGVLLLSLLSRREEVDSDEQVLPLITPAAPYGGALGGGQFPASVSEGEIDRAPTGIPTDSGGDEDSFRDYLERMGASDRTENQIAELEDQVRQANERTAAADKRAKEIRARARDRFKRFRDRTKKRIRQGKRNDRIIIVRDRLRDIDANVRKRWRRKPA